MAARRVQWFLYSQIFVRLWTSGFTTSDKRIPHSFPQVTLRDFSQVELLKVNGVDYVDSHFDILKDTALAETRACLFDPALRKA